MSVTARGLDRVERRIPAGSLAAVIGATGVTKRALVEHLRGRAPNVGIVLRDGGLFSSLSVRDNVAFLLRHETSMQAEQVDAIVAAQLDAVGLTRVASALPDELALGQRKRAGFARALAMDPELIVFDEPEAGLDRLRAALLAELIGHVHADRGGTYVVLTRDDLLARRVADCIVLIPSGAAGNYRATGEFTPTGGCSLPLRTIG